ncbi:MAG: hypothetical protein H7246_15820, partial [Phycisphaerae bacterium]|nr:hypothetical protein [Saprospiraceae bacterium]
MANFYSNVFARNLLTSCFLALPIVASAHDPGGPTNPDSLANFGHCTTLIQVDTNCVTHEVTLSAYIYWTWTFVHQPVVATWSNGLNAHKITVVPPGTWSWDPGITTCEVWHQYNQVTFDKPFFDGPVEITGPTAICPVDDLLELNTNLNYYSFFEELLWSPPNPAGDFEPFPITQPGTYGLTVTDAMGCTSSDQISVIEVPLFIPAVAGPARMCPEGDTATLSIVNPGAYQSFEWDNGDTLSPITVFDPGVYQVTATDSHGCTGVGSIGVLSGEVGAFNISVSSPTLCPGLLDTLRVLGGFINYSWSNNVMGITNIVNQAGTYTVTVTNVYGCTGTSSATVAPLLPPVIQIASTPLCVGDTAVLTTTGGSFPQYHWSSGETTQSINALLPGTYSVTVSGAGICVTSTNMALGFAPAPTTIIDPPAILNCLVNQTTLNGSNSSSGPNFPLIWTTPNGHFVSGDSTLNPTVDQPGTYILSIVNATTGCFTNDTIVVPQDIAPPPADAGPAAMLTCTVQNFGIGPVPTPADPDLLPSWSTLDGNILSGDFSWMPNVDQPGTYTVTITYALNGCTSTASVVIGEDIAPPTVQ